MSRLVILALFKFDDGLACRQGEPLVGQEPVRVGTEEVGQPLVLPVEFIAAVLSGAGYAFCEDEAIGGNLHPRPLDVAICLPTQSPAALSLLERHLDSCTSHKRSGFAIFGHGHGDKCAPPQVGCPAPELPSRTSPAGSHQKKCRYRGENSHAGPPLSLLGHVDRVVSNPRRLPATATTRHRTLNPKAGADVTADQGLRDRANGTQTDEEG
jgi:hypothetical protein